MKSPIERRLPGRERCRVSARLIDADSCITECKVIDLSVSGARLELPYASRIKNEFTLCIPSRGIERRVEVIWQADSEIGVHFMFETPAAAEAPVAKPAAPAKPMSLDRLRSLVKH